MAATVAALVPDVPSRVGRLPALEVRHILATPPNNLRSNPAAVVAAIMLPEDQVVVQRNPISTAARTLISQIKVLVQSQADQYRPTYARVYTSMGMPVPHHEGEFVFFDNDPSVDAFDLSDAMNKTVLEHYRRLRSGALPPMTVEFGQERG
jgi:hypothetical protein